VNPSQCFISIALPTSQSRSVNYGYQLVLIWRKCLELFEVNPVFAFNSDAAFVKRAANHTLDDTARRVVAEVQNQVNVLGRGTDIQRAIQMYGRIGANVDLVVTKTGFVGDPTHPVQERTMASLFMEDMIGTTEGIVEDVFYIPSTAIRRIFGFVSAHKILLVIVMFSILANVFLSARSTVTYWHQRNAERMMQKIGVKPNSAMVRMVSLKEIDDLVKTGLQGANATDASLW